MLALYLLASHLVGDYLLQTRWQADRKLDDFAYRVRHVTAYSFAFVPVVALSGVPFGRMCEFVVALFLLHLATDSRRFRSTLADVVVWLGSPDSPHSKIDKRGEWQRSVASSALHGYGAHSEQPIPDKWLRWPPPNPWPALPLAIDQTLHVVQLAALGWLLT